MYHLIKVVFIIFLTEELHQSTGYQWLPLNSGDPIPGTAVLIDFEYKTFIGRARHYGSVLPAEVYNSSQTYALISYCYQKIIKNQFEVLVATENCCWQRFDFIEDVRANIIRGGTTKENEPIFIGKTKRLMDATKWIPDEQIWVEYTKEDLNFRLASILLTSNEVIEWEYYPKNKKFCLTCEDNNTWVDTLAAKIPNNTISGGRSEYDDDIFVARLLQSGCETIPGQVIPRMGIATAVFDEHTVRSPFCQVLVGNKGEYYWISAENGEIPDYAVVAGKHGKYELMYVAKVNKTLGYITHKDALTYKQPYEILVKNNG